MRELLAADRLVTLTGPGGVGKTRLALAVAGAATGFPDGAWLVELAPVSPAGGPPTRTRSRPSSTPCSLHSTSSRAGRAGHPADRLTDALRPRQLLLVLDNCEHVVEPVAELVDRLLRAAPGLRVLATSREPLGLAGEVVWGVPPLDVPAADAEPEALADRSAVQLFVARAAAAAKGFRLDAGTAAPVAELCRRLDGIPLALELAATRVRALGVHGVVARLDDRFRLLAAGHRGAPPRQQTLQAMIDWSWELLSTPEQILLRRLAVHADGGTLDAAEAVCAGDDLPAADVPDLLARLVDRSLVDGGPRAAGTGCWSRWPSTAWTSCTAPARPTRCAAATPTTTSPLPSRRRPSCAGHSSHARCAGSTPRPPTCGPPSPRRQATRPRAARCGWSRPWPGTGCCAAGWMRPGAHSTRRSQRSVRRRPGCTTRPSPGGPGSR